MFFCCYFTFSCVALAAIAQLSAPSHCSKLKINKHNMTIKINVNYDTAYISCLEWFNTYCLFGRNASPNEFI